jgi:predicted MFS family arabinose efflux permease
MAYIAEIVLQEHHGWAMGMYTRTWYLGWVIGPALGGYLGDAIGFRLTFTIGAALMVFGLAATWLYVKEPRKAKQQQKHLRPSAYFS